MDRFTLGENAQHVTSKAGLALSPYLPPLSSDVPSVDFLSGEKNIYQELLIVIGGFKSN